MSTEVNQLRLVQKLSWHKFLVKNAHRSDSMPHSSARVLWQLLYVTSRHHTVRPGLRNSVNMSAYFVLWLMSRLIIDRAGAWSSCSSKARTTFNALCHTAMHSHEADVHWRYNCNDQTHLRRHGDARVSHSYVVNTVLWYQIWQSVSACQQLLCDNKLLVIDKGQIKSDSMFSHSHIQCWTKLFESVPLATGFKMSWWQQPCSQHMCLSHICLTWLLAKHQATVWETHALETWQLCPIVQTDRQKFWVFNQPARLPSCVLHASNQLNWVIAYTESAVTKQSQLTNVEAVFCWTLRYQGPSAKLCWQKKFVTFKANILCHCLPQIKWSLRQLESVCARW